VYVTVTTSDVAEVFGHTFELYTLNVFAKSERSRLYILICLGTEVAITWRAWRRNAVY